MNFKQYEKLDYIKYYKSKKYPKSTWPMLNEYFSRYKSLFELSDEEIKKKLQNVLDGIDKIELAGNKEDDYLGYYSSQEKTLRVNIEKLESFNDIDKMNTIFHELNHAGEFNYKTNNYNGFEIYDYQKNSFSGIALNEIITEMKASMLFKNDISDMANTGNVCDATLNLTGYGDLIFLGNMLHNTLGLTQKEFIKLADEGKQYFDNEMVKKFSNPEEYNNFINTFSFYADTLHAIKYNRENKSTVYTQEDLENLNNCISSIRDNCLYIMGRRIKNEAYTNRYKRGNKLIDNNFIEKSKLELDSIDVNYIKGLSFIQNANELPTMDINSRIETNSYFENIKETLVTFETLNDKENSLTFLDKSLILYELKETEYTSNTLMLEHNIDINAYKNLMYRTQDLTDVTNFLNNKYSEKLWNNSNIYNLVSKFCEGKFLYRIKKKIKNRLSKNKFKELPDSRKIAESDYQRDSTKNKLFDMLNKEQNRRYRNFRL